MALDLTHPDQPVDRALLLYTTFPDQEVALAVGETLVRERLAACVNVIPSMRSVYAWEGAIEHAAEVVAIVKSREGLRAELEAALKARHPYRTPIILALGPLDGDPATLAWIAASTGAAAS